jgi:hypothetical protein
MFGQPFGLGPGFVCRPLLPGLHHFTWLIWLSLQSVQLENDFSIALTSSANHAVHRMEILTGFG